MLSQGEETDEESAFSAAILRYLQSAQPESPYSHCVCACHSLLLTLAVIFTIGQQLFDFR